MDYERFKEGFQDALKAELAVRGADVELTARRVDKMNESYDAITVRPTDSSIGVNISVEKAFAAYENGTPIPEIAEHFADAVEKGFRESPQVDLESLSNYEQMKSKLSMEVVSAEKNAELLESRKLHKTVFTLVTLGNQVENQLLGFAKGLSAHMHGAAFLDSHISIRIHLDREILVLKHQVKEVARANDIIGVHSHFSKHRRKRNCSTRRRAITKN